MNQYPWSPAALGLKGCFKAAVIHGPRAAIKTATPFHPEKTCTGKKGTFRDP